MSFVFSFPRLEETASLPQVQGRDGVCGGEPGQADGGPGGGAQGEEGGHGEEVQDQDGRVLQAGRGGGQLRADRKAKVATSEVIERRSGKLREIGKFLKV